ncbi:MAG: cyclic nucleotide-binding domain-containing protein [Spirochaetota bacterium]|nr:cyclic nucleotide-binding domain-containing protein [Spirochaetota bacterium]
MLSAEDLKKYMFFRNFSNQALSEIARRLDTVIITKGIKIIKQNTPPDYFYFVIQGELEITKRTKFGQDAIITTIQSGEGFGEVALITSSHRQNTVTAKTDVTLYRLNKRDFEDITTMDSTFKSLLQSKAKAVVTYNKIKTLQPLALLEPEKMITLMDKMTEKTFQPKETIITIDEEGDFYYIIKKGKVSVIKRKNFVDKDSEMVEMAVLSDGEGFGEEALIRDEPRGASIRAIDETTVLMLNKDDFNDILKTSFIEFSFPDKITEGDIGRFVIIDSRTPIEYKEEHIEGAINIPLYELRHRYAELDKTVEYLTYSTNDSRGMAAAFLLATQGFNAKNIKNGLNGWLGPVTCGSDGIYLPE